MDIKRPYRAAGGFIVLLAILAGYAVLLYIATTSAARADGQEAPNIVAPSEVQLYVDGFGELYARAKIAGAWHCYAIELETPDRWSDIYTALDPQMRAAPGEPCWIAKPGRYAVARKGNPQSAPVYDVTLTHIVGRVETGAACEWPPVATTRRGQGLRYWGRVRSSAGTWGLASCERIGD